MDGVSGGTLADLDVLAHVVAEAFVEDPLMVWLLPDAQTRFDGTLRWWTPLVARYLTSDRALVTAGSAACLLWRGWNEQLPDAAGQPPMTDVFADLVPPGRRDLVTAALSVFPTLRPTADYLYVHVVAASPGAQRRGHGTDLIRALVEAHPTMPLICLESTNPRNHTFYRRNGFTPAAIKPLPGSTVTATAFHLDPVADRSQPPSRRTP